MMRSNLLSRLLPSNPAGRSIYEDLRAHDEASESDLEERAGMGIDEENLGYHDDDLVNADLLNGEDSAAESTTFAADQQQTRIQSEGKGQREKTPGPIAWTFAGEPAKIEKTHTGRSKWLAQSPRLLDDDGDDDVPASLLIEGHGQPEPSVSTQPRIRSVKSKQKQPVMPSSGPSTRETRARWEAAQAQQLLHQDDGPSTTGPPPVQQHTRLLTGSARDKAMWRWINVVNLDNFMMDTYEYYQGSGIWCIVLQRVLELVQTIFVAVFTTFLTQCVDYHKIPGSKRLSDSLVPQCTRKISGMPNLAIWLFTLFVFLRMYFLLTDIPRLARIRDFYEHLLGVPDSDMQTISWQDVVGRIMALRDANPVTVEKISPRNRKYLGSQSKQRLDAHDIANRLMRRENYLIALVNKEVLDLTLPLPFLHGRQLFSRTLLWNLDWCIMDLVFNEQGQVRQLILKDSHRKQLSNGLRDRFLFAGFINVLLAPVIIIYTLTVYFFRYFNEYQKNPSALGSRQYTPLAEWKFREFNELGHLFHKRVNMSYPFASRYLEQFPSVKTVHFARFVAFVSGAIVSVLAVASLLDPELFVNFEITPDRTVIFYITIFGGLWALMNGTIPDENLVFEPEYALRNVIEYIHYMPNHWQERLHSDEVKREFGTLYKLKIIIFFEELLSIIFTPFILWFSLPKCSDQIIDFFREFTIHVDGVGYVCSFAVFDFKKGDSRRATQAGASADVRDDYYATKNGKMAASYFGFLDNYLLNPKTGVQGHVPPGMRPTFHPPPSFPGLMSPTLAAEMQTSRMGRSERRPGKGPQSARTPRFAPTGTHSSPMPSILLDPHHQPSSSGFGAKSARRSSRSRYQSRHNIVEEPIEDEDESGGGKPNTKDSGSRDQYESEAGGLDESKWEISPTRAASKDVEDESGPENGGVLGLLYQFQKAQTDRPGVHI